MPLDPEIRAMADEVRAMGLPRIDDVSVAQARAGYSTRYRERSLPPPADVRVEHLKIPGPKGSISARLYRPASEQGAPLPLTVYFHGGGFVLGDADGYELQSMALAAHARCAIVFAEYRLAPEHPFPAAVDDAIAAVEWLAANGERLGVDAGRLVLMGDSAGGNLCINVSLAARDRGSPRIALQVLLYPATDFRPYCAGSDDDRTRYPSVEEFRDGFLLDRDVMDWFTRHYLSRPRDAMDPRASPMLASDLSRLPPTVVVTAEYDPLRDMGAAFAKRLEVANVPAEYHCAAGLAHNFMGHVAKSTAARRAFTKVADILRDRVAAAGSDL